MPTVTQGPGSMDYSREVIDSEFALNDRQKDSKYDSLLRVVELVGETRATFKFRTSAKSGRFVSWDAISGHLGALFGPLRKCEIPAHEAATRRTSTSLQTRHMLSIVPGSAGGSQKHGLPRTLRFSKENQAFWVS